MANISGQNVLKVQLCPLFFRAVQITWTAFIVCELWKLLTRSATGPVNRPQIRCIIMHLVILRNKNPAHLKFYMQRLAESFKFSHSPQIWPFIDVTIGIVSNVRLTSRRSWAGRNEYCLTAEARKYDMLFQCNVWRAEPVLPAAKTSSTIQE